MTTRAPTLAWLLTALASFLLGTLVAEGRHQTVRLPAVPTVGVVVTVEVTYPTVAPPTPTPTVPPPTGRGVPVASAPTQPSAAAGSPASPTDPATPVRER